MGRCGLILLAFVGMRRRPAGRGRRCREHDRRLRLQLGGARRGPASRSGSRPTAAATAPAGRPARPGWSAPCSRSARRARAEGRREGDRFLPSRYRRPQRVARRRQRSGASPSPPTAGPRRSRCRRTDLAEREPVPEALQVGPGPRLAGACRHRRAPRRASGSTAQSFDGRRAVRRRARLRRGRRRRRARLHGIRAACSPARRAPGASARAARPSASRGASGCAAACTATGFWPVRLEAPSRFGTVAARLISVDGVPAAG